MLYLTTAKGSIEDVLEIVSDFDWDFNGNNGIECLWDGVVGYDSNMEYLLDTTKDLPPRKRVKEFMDRWLGHDSYYLDYNYILSQNNGEWTLTLAYVTEY